MTSPLELCFYSTQPLRDYLETHLDIYSFLNLLRCSKTLRGSHHRRSAAIEHYSRPTLPHLALLSKLSLQARLASKKIFQDVKQRFPPDSGDVDVACLLQTLCDRLAENDDIIDSLLGVAKQCSDAQIKRPMTV